MALRFIIPLENGEQFVKLEPEQWHEVPYRSIIAKDFSNCLLAGRCYSATHIGLGLNDWGEHFSAIAGLADRLHSVQAVHVLPYHPLGTSKSRHLGKPAAFETAVRPEAAQVQEWVEQIQGQTGKPVLRGWQSFVKGGVRIQ